jgi:phosphatidylglycerol---prolipoprotein diacylglyceryl transferase
MIEWNIDPVLFTLGPLSPRWYGVLFALAFVASYQVMRKMFSDADKPQKDLDSLTISMIVGTILGARLGHVFFYEPHIMLDDPLETFAVWHGGLASHGGALGIIVGLWWFNRKRKGYGMVWLLDRLAIVAALSGAFIRIGNFFNSEILGRASDVPWAVWFMRVDPAPIYRHPAQLYEALLCLLIFGLLWWRYRSGDARRAPGRLIGLFLVLLFSGRFLIEFVKEVQVDFETALPLDMGQLLSIPFVLVGGWFLLKVSRSPRTT